MLTYQFLLGFYQDFVRILPGFYQENLGQPNFSFVFCYFFGAVLSHSVSTPVETTQYMPTRSLQDQLLDQVLCPHLRIVSVWDGPTNKGPYIKEHRKTLPMLRKTPPPKK